jgi:DNA mismatch endonuclease, patch repair protein
MERSLRKSRRRRMNSPKAPDAARSRVMAAIRSRDTRPERLVRSMVHGLGFRFRLHCDDLPGSPDLVFPRLGMVVFVNGCFWHRHACAAGRKQPSHNRQYWQRKFERNAIRDIENHKALRRLGWRVLVVWECTLRRPETVKKRLLRFLKSGARLPKKPTSPRTRLRATAMAANRRASAPGRRRTIRGFADTSNESSWAGPSRRSRTAPAVASRDAPSLVGSGR